MAPLVTTVKTITIPLSWVDSLCDLSAIHKTYSDQKKLGWWQDDYSKRLFTWMETTWNDVCLDVANIDTTVKKAIECLGSRVLFNEMAPIQPLRDPKLDRRLWTWENDDLELYKKESEGGQKNLSPYDGKQMLIIDHLFAKAVLDWTKTVPLSAISSSVAIAIAPETEDEKVFKLFCWDQMLEAIQAKEVLEALGEDVKALSVLSNANKQAASIAIADKVTAAKLADEEELAALKAEVDAMEQDHKKVKELISKKTEKAKDELKALIEKREQLEKDSVAQVTLVENYTKEIFRRTAHIVAMLTPE